MAKREEKTIIGEVVDLSLFGESRSPRRACLVQYSGSKIGKRYIFDEDELVLGRVEGVHILVQDMSVSRRHARFSRSPSHWIIEDMGSANGTYVQERKVSRAELNHGDMLRLGNIVFKYFADGSSEGALVDNIYKRATIDPTTGIYNKNYLRDELESHFKLARNYHRPLSLLIFDLDHFKKVNDTHGHNCGDEVLKQSAELAKGVIRKNDVLARFGGEEFVVILPETDIKAAFELAERIRFAFDQFKFKYQGKTLEQTVSVGVAQFQPAMQKCEDLLEVADQKLYASKRSGRNKVSA
jgi:diguanylate cyclase (GGDEF)-like protein